MTEDCFGEKRIWYASRGLPESPFDHAFANAKEMVQKKTVSVKKSILLAEGDMTIPVVEQDKLSSKLSTV
jgi:hypothetical protein